MRIKLLLFLVLPALAPAADWYVSGAGSDSNDGRSLAAPFRNIQKAASQVQPGDVVNVMNGEYTDAQSGWTAVELTRSGTADAWITFRAYPGHTPHIRFRNWAGFTIHAGASYIEIRGFELRGPRADVRFEVCRADALKQSPDATCNSNGITIDGRQDGAKKPHHIRIAGNRIWQCPGGGIAVMQADYVTVEDNVVYENAWYSRYATSGISFYQAWNSDQSTATKMIVRRNRVYDNRALVDWSAGSKALSDGNGIIIDDNRSTQSGGVGAYNGRFLVENNLSFNNGGGGITLYSSDHIDVINNTTFKNSQVVDYGEVFVNQCGDVRVENNVMVSRSGAATFNTGGSTGLSVDFNLYFNGTVKGTPGAHDLTADPLFTVAETDQALADFHPLPGSPALASALASAAPSDDLFGNPRPGSPGPSRGALELRQVNARPARPTPGQ